jgi:nucleoside-diphosphate-sugar epimerase
MAKVLVTGGSGFIGSHLCTLLHKMGHVVFSLDINDSSPKPWKVITSDIREDIIFPEIDAVVHLAAQISVVQSMEIPAETISINVDGTSKVIEAAKRAGATRFIFASSAAVYGDAEEIPITESAPMLPQSPYAESKISGEEMVRNSGMKTCSMRFFNIYGPGQSSVGGYAAVIPAFKKAITSNQSPKVFGDGSQVRDFVHVSDLVRIIELAIEAEDLPSEVNIASGQRTSLLDLLRALNEINPIMCEPTFSQVRSGDIHTSVADISRMVQYFNPGKMIQLSTGLEW